MRAFRILILLVSTSALSLRPVTADNFTEIRSICRGIDNAVKSGKLTVKKLNQMSYYLGSSTGYYKNHELKYIRGASGGEENNITDNDMYFDGGKIIFIRTGSNVNENNKYLTEEFYFSNEKLIRWKNASGKIVDKADHAFSEKETYLLKKVKTSVEELNSQP